ncbi:MAG: SpoIIE family protein phosphatase [Thermosynechococcaceae cyanobacterium]
MMNAQVEILVVDDNEVNIRLLMTMLSSRGYSVSSANCGEMALAAINSALPDLILLDISMPDIDGYEVCQRLKANEQTQDIPVIFISALDEVMDKLKGFKVGGVDYITKPFQALEVQARVKTHVGMRQLQKELQLKTRLLEAERARAGRIQADLLPKTVPHLPGFELAARCLPAQDVSGDFYDWYLLDTDRLNLTLGDVMGKGMPAALLMTTVRATLRALSVEHSPLVQIEYAHSLLEPDLSQSESFVTLFHAQLNCQDRQLSYVDVGHGLVFIKRANGQIESLANGGSPMGILPEQVYQAGSLTFEPNDALMIFSDGLTEVFPDAIKKSEVFIPLLQGATGAEAILKQVFDFIPMHTSLPDDLTVLILYCNS